MPMSRLIPTRSNGDGMSDGISLKCGWKPPALMMNVGWSPKDARNANCPVIEMKATREWISLASNAIFSGSKTTVPTKSRRRYRSARSADISGGSATMAWPSSVNWLASTSSPMRTVTRLGVAHPSSSMGPMMKLLARTGNNVRSVLMICGALATGLSGKSTASSWPALNACDSAGGLAVCCTPIRPPMPVNVKPNDNWIAGNCPKISSSSEKPASECVLRIAIALTSTASILSSRMPA